MGQAWAVGSGRNSSEHRSRAWWAVSLLPPPPLLPGLFVQMLVPISGNLSWTDGFPGGRLALFLLLVEIGFTCPDVVQPIPCPWEGEGMCLARASRLTLAGPVLGLLGRNAAGSRSSQGGQYLPVCSPVSLGLFLAGSSVSSQIRGVTCQ